MESGGSWSVYWYNGAIVNSEIARGLDILELMPSEYISQNEIDAARTVQFDYKNVQGQQQFVWPPSFALARAYLDQLERSSGLAADRIASARQALDSAEQSSGSARGEALSSLASELHAVADAPATRPRCTRWRRRWRSWRALGQAFGAGPRRGPPTGTAMTTAQAGETRSGPFRHGSCREADAARQPVISPAITVPQRDIARSPIVSS